MTVNVVSGLKKKRDELSKQLLNHRTEMHKTIAALDSLDSTIRLYDPTFKPESDYNRQPGKINRWFRKGEKPALILDYFRESANDVLPTTEIINYLSDIKGLNRDMIEKEHYNAFYNSCLKGLQQMGKAGTLAEDHRDRGVIYWRLA